MAHHLSISRLHLKRFNSTNNSWWEGFHLYALLLNY